MVKMIYNMGLFTFPHFRSAGRPERMGHNTVSLWDGYYVW